MAGSPFGQSAVRGLHLLVGGVVGQLKHGVWRTAGTRAKRHPRGDRQPRRFEAAQPSRRAAPAEHTFGLQVFCGLGGYHPSV